MHKNTANKCHIFALGFPIDIMHNEFPILCIKSAYLCITLCIIPMEHFSTSVSLVLILTMKFQLKSCYSRRNQFSNMKHLGNYETKQEIMLIHLN